DPKDADALFNLALAQERLAKQQQTPRGPGRPVPGIPSEGAIPTPDADEAESLLARLEADERQRQAETSRHDGLPDPAAESPAQLARRLLKEAEQSVTRQLEKDW
ncbi:MAG: hypothetical protein FJZ00_11655, partial [Candidatus Sericytochromatia bacterium]|nr:hypothetical protein [Candidatus Tanganyikabacteria bacterium]